MSTSGYKIYRGNNSALFGLDVSTRFAPPYQRHPMIRNDWRSIDQYRDAQGYVPAIRSYSISEGADLITQVDERGAAATFQSPFSPQGEGTGEESFYHVIGTDNNNVETHVISVEFDSYDWNYTNEFAQNDLLLTNLLLQDDPGGSWAGLPYFAKYFYLSPGDDPDGNGGLLTTDDRMLGATQNTRPLINRQSFDQDILNHKFSYRYYDRSMENSSYNIEIDSIYNLFLDTDPDYETAISAVPESLLPNYYHLEIAIHQIGQGFTGQVPVYGNTFLEGETDATFLSAQDYVSVLEGAYSGSNALEDQTNSQGYLQLYANKINGVMNNPAAPLRWRNQFQNVAVLSADINAGVLESYNNIPRDDRGTPDTADDFSAIQCYPFYNKISIPFANQWGEAAQSGGNISYDAIGGAFEAMRNDGKLGSDWVDNFLICLELLVLDQYSLQPTALGDAGSATVPFTLYDHTDNDALVAANANTFLPLQLENVLFGLQAGPGNPVYDTLANFLVQGSGGEDQITNFWHGNAGVNPSTSFVQAQGAALLAFADGLYNWFDTLLNVARLETARDILKSFKQEFSELHLGLAGPCASEPVMYMVEKRVIAPGQLAADASTPPVQRLFFGRGTEKGAVYYDTQIKYGVRYQYDIKQIRMIIGEAYNYHNVYTIANSGAVGQGRAIGNALGFYAPERQQATITPTYTAIVNDLQDFDYLPEDEETQFAPSYHMGYYVYVIPNSPDIGAYFDMEDILGPPTNAPGSPLGSALPGGHDVQDAQTLSPGRPSIDWTDDLQALQIRMKQGFGFDGNPSGGAMGTRAYQVLDNVLPPVAPEDDGGEDGPPSNPAQEAIDEMTAINEAMDEINQASEDVALDVALDTIQLVENINTAGAGEIALPGGNIITIPGATGVDPLGPAGGMPGNLVGNIQTLGSTPPRPDMLDPKESDIVVSQTPSQLQEPSQRISGRPDSGLAASTAGIAGDNFTADQLEQLIANGLIGN